MINKFYDLDFRVFPILILVLYVPFHILEEALNGFPEWMSKQYGLPIVLSYPHWLINNSFFFITLTIGLYFFLKSEKYLFMGVGILIWSMMNGLEHIVGSILTSGIVPGFYTGILFIVISIIGFSKLKHESGLTMKLLIVSFLFGLLYWFIPIGLIILTGNYWLKLLY